MRVKWVYRPRAQIYGRRKVRRRFITAPSLPEAMRTLVVMREIAVTAGDQFRIVVKRTEGTETLETVKNGSSLTLQFKVD